MKNILQNPRTRLYLTRSGKLTANQKEAAAWASIVSATKFCAFMKLDLTQFVYRSVAA